MGDRESKIRLAIGSAAGAAAIFAPLKMKWKGVLTGVAASEILSGISRKSPAKWLLGMRG